MSKVCCLRETKPSLPLGQNRSSKELMPRGRGTHDDEGEEEEEIEGERVKRDS